MSHHISRQFDEELEQVRSRVMAMGGLVEENLAQAVQALVEGDSERARDVVTADYKVNALEVSIDEECTQILARRQPAASDLRFIIAVIKTITDLERIGDEAERIAHMTIRIAEANAEKTLLVEIETLAGRVRSMLHQALDAFARMDADAAVEVWRADEKIDQAYESIMRQLITFMMEDPRTIPRALGVMWSARALERIGDRARNICEYVIYLVRGKDVRHTSIEHMEQAVQRERR